MFIRRSIYMAYLQHLLSKIGVAFLLMDRSDVKGDTLLTPYFSLC
jgi:hypothetical protein